MAIIGIKKLIEINDTGYYVVSIQSHTMYNLYMGIDKQKQVIHFYENNNCSKPNLSIDYKNDYEMTGEFPGIDTKVLFRVSYLASKIFECDSFPDSDIWASCGS